MQRMIKQKEEMLTHHYDEEKTEHSETMLQKRRNSAHGALHIKPIIMISRLKRKVKARRNERGSQAELSDGASTQYGEERTSTKSDKQASRNGSPTGSSTPQDRSRSHTSPAALTKRKSSSENGTNNSITHDAVFETEEHNSVTQDNSEDNKASTLSDAHKKLKEKRAKCLQPSKSLPESNHQKRRPPVRRTAFQIRDEDFASIFRELPSNEQLIIAFPCALRRDVYIHGRMFLSENYISFYTCFFKWEESLSIPYTDITSITREKAAKLVPNAIKIRTKNQEQYIFVSVIPREKVFLAVFRIWQNALLDQPLDYNQLRALVYNDQQHHDETSGESEESLSLENVNGATSSEHGLQTQSLPTTSSQTVEERKEAKLSQRRTLSSLSENEVEPFLPSCTCETHYAKTFADRLFNYNVDTLFEYLTGDNEFNRNFHSTQKLTDYVYGEWTVNPETGKRERIVTYKTINQSILGTNTLSCREKQTLLVEQPHVMYILKSEVYNEGVKYTDAFFVATQFCMTQRDAEHSSIKISAEINYIKSVNGFVKSFIEKNSYAAIEGGVNEQVRRLAEQENKQSKRKQNRKTAVVSKSCECKESNEDICSSETSQDSAVNTIASNESKLSPTTRDNIIYNIAILIGVCLLMLHIYLCYKLHSVDQSLLTLDSACLNQCRQSKSRLNYP
ncbi:unnamed protein product [Adineta ricciae]|uniref:VASt domain-containing protein n=1 Tax=Adineta ricciae TaxID=249248 RepID=A0A814BX65_ADIRI|nr:unnamed protein product [Adineta ricciae]